MEFLKLQEKESITNMKKMKVWNLHGKIGILEYLIDDVQISYTSNTSGEKQNYKISPQN